MAFVYEYISTEMETKVGHSANVNVIAGNRHKEEEEEEELKSQLFKGTAGIQQQHNAQ